MRSPINGIVDNIRTTTIGGVIGPGEPLMDIVPTNGKLVIEAKLRAIDRGYVREGQPAVVKISTYDFVRYGALEGTVVRVAPDAAAGERGEPYFPVKVEKASPISAKRPTRCRSRPACRPLSTSTPARAP
ncbi:MAG: HlyD family efflux transporter periplasmic adaptor subunit [Rhodospirillales bacterium]